MATANGLASTAVDVFGPEMVETMRSVQPNPVLIHASPPCKGHSQASASTGDQKQIARGWPACVLLPPENVQILFSIKKSVLESS